MPVSYQIVPEHKYPHQMVQINDNTEVVDTYSAMSDDRTAMLCVFASPKGRDNKVITISEGGAQAFVEEFGLGAFATYGQPLLNAYRVAASGAASVHCLRVTPENASYSNTTIIAKYKVTPAVPGDETNPDGTPATLEVAFFAKSSDDELTSLDDLDIACTVSPDVDADGFTAVKLFTIASQGKGVYGKNFRIRLTADRTSDKENPYKNYFLGVYTNENGLTQKEQFSVVFDEDATYNGESKFADDLVNDLTDGSTRVKMLSFMDGFLALYEAYKSVQPDCPLSFSEFDPFFGLNKNTKAPLPGYTVISEAEAAPADDTEAAVALSATNGVALTGGSDGDLASTDATVREAALKNLYLQAFSGNLDPTIKSKNRFPSTMILDANFPVEVKLAIASLAVTRTDCMAILDCGTSITTKSSVLPWVKENIGSAVANRVITIEGYCMKVRDPYSKKTVTVTSTWWLAGRYPAHILQYGGKHKPLAGNVYGIISDYIPNSIYPLFDEDLDSVEMDELAENHINFAKYNPNQVTVRATQDTFQSKQSALSEQNNVLILLDVKRDCERVAAHNEYDFTDPSDIARFNTALDTITSKYAAAQVTSISANFAQNDWEKERNILHLYVSIVNKGLVRTTIIEIDVNRATATA